MSHQKRDYKAEFGRQPAWDLQRAKQDEVAEEYYNRLARKEAEHK